MAVVGVVCLFGVMGFDFSRSLIPLSDVIDGGPPKDGIPALTDPVFVSIEEATSFMRPTDRILGLVIDGEAKAYPIKILNWHELVNDTVGGRFVLVTYCPLCASGLAFDAAVEGRRMIFGVSGKLYNNNVLFYDHIYEGLWSQLKGMALTGPMAGYRLQALPLVHTTWEDWIRRHPHSRVLSHQTGYNRPYEVDPYAGYERTKAIYFPLTHRDERLPAKELVAGVVIGGQAKAYRLISLGDKPRPFKDEINGKTVTIDYDPHTRAVRVFDERKHKVPVVIAYWFAWAAFHPDTQLMP